MAKISTPGNIEAIDFEGTLISATGRLSLLLYQIELKFNLAEYMKKIRSYIITGKLNAEVIELEMSECIINESTIKPYKIHFKHACVYTELAKISLEKGDEEKAWSFMSQANHRIGLAQGGITTYLTHRL